MTDKDDDEQPGAQPLYPSRGPDREGMVHDYLPEDEEWVAKTVLDLQDPHAVAALSQFGQMFPEVDDLQPMIDDFIQEFLKGRTSVKGQGRKEYNRIFESMWGGHPDTETSRMATLLGADVDDD